MASRKAPMLVPLLPVTMAAGLPTSAFAVDYMTPQQAQQLLFPAADHFEIKTVKLNASQLQSLQQRYGVSGRSSEWKVSIAMQGDKALGYVLVDNVVGKFELITYAVGLQLDGAVKQVEILSYRESHGGEIRLPAWRKQFVGKGAQAPLQAGLDISNISGATLSCSHVTEGVKRIVSVIDLARNAGLLGV